MATVVTRVTCSAACALILTAGTAGQTPVQFEVASIRPSATDAQPERASIGIHVDGSQVRISYLSLKDYIARAYGVTVEQVAGPDWIGSARFDIAAKIPDGVAPSRVPEMLQTLLATRFEMKSHHESREFPVYALAVGKDGPRLTATKTTDDSGAAAPPGTLNVTAVGSANGVSVDLGDGSFFSLVDNHLEVTKVTLPQLANVLGRFVDRPVIDATGVTGGPYDFMLGLSPDDYQASLMRAALKVGIVLPPQALRLLDGASSDPFSSSLQKAGLTLESRKAPFDVIAVDSMRKTPTDN